MKSPHPLISVVISTYNGSKYLAEQLDSVFNQTYPNLEIVVVDDGSSDNTVEIIQKYKNRHDNLKLFLNEQNLGYIKSFERGMSLSAGKYISVCDQDDVWDRDKINILYQNRENYHLIYCDSELVDQDLKPLNKKLSTLKNLGTYKNPLVFATDNCIAGHATLITRELFQLSTPFHAAIPHDHWLAYIASMNGGVKYVDKPLVQYRNHVSNVIGAVSVTKKKRSSEEKRLRSKRNMDTIRIRIKAFYEKCYQSFGEEKKVMADLVKSYESFSLPNNLLRVNTFLKNKELLLAIKKRNPARKTFFCFKMFYKIK